MSDKRYKPIGGMFQGVRGSTTTSSGSSDKGMLVKLNDEGKVDPSCLVDPESMTEGLRLLSERLNEIALRVSSFQTKVNNLNSSISTVRQDFSAADTSLNNKISTEKTERQNADSQINAKIGSDTAENTILYRISRLESTVSAIDLTRFQEVVQQLANTVQTVSGNYAAIVAKIGNEQTEGTILYRLSVLEDDIETLDRAINDLEERVEALEGGEASEN